MITSKMAWLDRIRKLIDGFYSPSWKFFLPPLWLLIQPKGSVSLIFLFFFSSFPVEGRAGFKGWKRLEFIPDSKICKFWYTWSLYSLITVRFWDLTGPTTGLLIGCSCSSQSTFYYFRSTCVAPNQNIKIVW